MARLTLASLSMVHEERCEVWRLASNILAAALRRPLNLPDREYKQLKIFTPHVDACLRYNPSDTGPDTYLCIKAFSRLYSEIGRWEDAAKLNKDWLDKNKEELGDESSTVLACREELAHNFQVLDQEDKAIELWQHILKAKSRTLGDDRPEVLEAMGLLAFSLRSSQPQKSIELAEHVSEVSRRVLGEEHPETLSIMNCLAFMLCDRSQDALKIQTQVYDIRLRLWGEEHLDTIFAMYCLASTYYSINRFEDAIVLLERAVKLRKKLQGGGFSVMLGLMYMLVLTYSRSHRFQDAVQLGEQLVKLSKEKLGDEHPTTLQNEELLAMHVSAFELHSHISEFEGLLDNGSDSRFQNVIHVAEQLLKLSKENLGDEHPNTLRYEGLLADYVSILKLQTHMSELRSLLDNWSDLQPQNAVHSAEQLVELSKEKLGDEHPTVLQCERFLAKCVSMLKLQTHISELKSKLNSGLNQLPTLQSEPESKISELGSETNEPDSETNVVGSAINRQSKKRKRM